MEQSLQLIPDEHVTYTEKNFVFFFFNTLYFIYLFGCARSQLWYVGSLVVACELLVAACRIQLPHQGLVRERKVQTTGPPGKCPSVVLRYCDVDFLLTWPILITLLIVPTACQASTKISSLPISDNMQDRRGDACKQYFVAVLQNDMATYIILTVAT